MKIKFLLPVLFIFSLASAQQKIYPKLSEVDFYKGDQVMRWQTDNKKYWNEETKDSSYSYYLKMPSGTSDSAWIKKLDEVYTRTDSVILKLNDEFANQFRIISFELVYVTIDYDVFIIPNKGSRFDFYSIRMTSNLQFGDAITLRKVKAVEIKSGIQRDLNSATIYF